MTQKRMETLIMTLLLLALAGSIHWLYVSGIISKHPIFSEIMAVATAVYVFGGCVLQTFGLRKISFVLSIIIFFVLCVCLFYSISALDFIVFIICCTLFARKASNVCDVGCFK